MLRDQFDETDVQEIMKRAVSIDAIDSANLQKRLTMAADEMGISRESVELAQEQWLNEKRRLQKEQVAKQKRLREFWIHACVFAAVNVFLIVINVLTWSETHQPWVLYCLFGWGIGLVSHALSLKMPIDAEDGEESHDHRD